MKILKTSLAGFLLLTMMLSSCEENITEPQITVNDNTEDNLTFTFTDEEVDELMLSKFGRSLNTYKEKSDFLHNHIHTNLIVAEPIIGYNPSGAVKVSCVAGIYNNGNWTFDVDNGYTNEFVYASKRIRTSLATEVGASTSIFIDWNNDGAFGTSPDYYDVHSTNPTTPNCSNGDEGTYGNAKSFRMSDGTIELYTLVKCDD